MRGKAVKCEGKVRELEGKVWRKQEKTRGEKEAKIVRGKGKSRDNGGKVVKCEGEK